jgi:hypothetical protein
VKVDRCVSFGTTLKPRINSYKKNYASKKRHMKNPYPPFFGHELKQKKREKKQRERKRIHLVCLQDCTCSP